MKKQLFSFLLVLTFVFSVSAQEKVSKKIAELPSFWETEYVRATLDSYFVELINKPEATGFVVFYEGKYNDKIYDKKGNIKTKTYLPRHGEANFRMQVIRKHIGFRKQNPNRFLFIDGGFREEFGVELWIVPKGADLPKPTPTLENMEYRKGQPSFNYKESS